MNKYEFKGELPIKTNEGATIATNFNRVVHGKRGAYVEFLDEQIIRTAIKIPEGSEWRLNDTHPAGHLCYFVLYCPKGEKIRIYHQKRTADYADYVIGRWYVSPKYLQGFEVIGKYDNT
jgi:hypothetical protein